MKIEGIELRKILDSRGEWTVEVILESEGIKEKASVPSGKSVGSYEARNLNYEEILRNLDEFRKLIKEKNFESSKEFDEFLIEIAGKNKEKFGANFVLGCSIAFARLLARFNKKELFEYLHETIYADKRGLNTQINADEKFQNSNLKSQNDNSKFKMSEHNDSNNIGVNPRESVSSANFMLNIIGGGVHSFNNLDFQEYWLVSKLNEKYDLEVFIAEIISIINSLEEKLPKPLGRNDEGAFCTNFSDNYTPIVYLKDIIEKQQVRDSSFEVRDSSSIFDLGLDIAANQIKNITNYDEVYKKLKLLDVKYLEDPYPEEEFDKFRELRKNFGFKVIGDDLTTTNVERLKIALERESVDGVIVKPNQIGTILETYQFVKLAKENNLFTIFSHRSGETNDNWIIDLGIAFKTDYFKIGPPLQGERITKWNRLLEILKND